MPSNPIHQSDIRLNYGLLATIFESAMEGPKEKQFFSSCIQQIQHNNPEQQQSLNHMFYSVITRPQGYRAFLNYIQDQIQKFIVESSPRDFIPSSSSSPYHHQAANNNLHGHNYQQSSHYSPNIHSSGHHGSSGAAFPVSLMGGSNGGGGGGGGGNSKASPISSPRQMMNINAKQYILVTEYTFVCVFQELVLVPSSPSTATAASANARQQQQQPQQQQPQQQQQRTFTRNMFRPIQEYRLLDIFDTLDTQARGVIRMRDMYMVLVCLVARQASILTKFLYQFGEYIFQMFREIPPHYSEIPLMSRGHHHYGPSLLSTHRNVMDIDKDVYQNQNQSHNSGVIKMEHVLKLATVAQISISRVQREMNKVIRASAPKILEKNVAATSSSTSSSSPSNTHSSSPTVAFQQLLLLEDNYSRMISKEDFMLIYFAVFSSEASSSYSSGSSKISSTRN